MEDIFKEYNLWAMMFANSNHSPESVPLTKSRAETGDKYVPGTRLLHNMLVLSSRVVHVFAVL